MRYISCLAFLMATNFVHAYGTVTAVTTDKGSMINVTIANGTTYRYSNCNNYTPYFEMKILCNSPLQGYQEQLSNHDLNHCF